MRIGERTERRTDMRKLFATLRTRLKMHKNVSGNFMQYCIITDILRSAASVITPFRNFTLTFELNFIIMSTITPPTPTFSPFLIGRGPEVQNVPAAAVSTGVKLCGVVISRRRSIRCYGVTGTIITARDTSFDVARIKGYSERIAIT